MKSITTCSIILLFFCQCAGSLGPYVWNQNPDTSKFEELSSAEKTAVKNMAGIWTLSVLSEEGEKRKLICVYDKQNSSFHFLTLQDPTSTWLPGELRYSFPFSPNSESKELLGMAFTQGYIQHFFSGRKERSRRGTGIQAIIEPKQIIIKYLEDTEGGQNLDGTALIRGSIQILKK